MKTMETIQMLQEIMGDKVFKQPLQEENAISIQLTLPRLSTFLWCLGQPQWYLAQWQTPAGKKHRWAWIDHFHKWRPVINSFANIKISLSNLILNVIIQKSFYSETRLVRLRILNWPPFMKGVYETHTQSLRTPLPPKSAIWHTKS